MKTVYVVRKYKDNNRFVMQSFDEFKKAEEFAKSSSISFQIEQKDVVQGTVIVVEQSDNWKG